MRKQIRVTLRIAIWILIFICAQKDNNKYMRGSRAGGFRTIYRVCKVRQVVENILPVSVNSAMIFRNEYLWIAEGNIFFICWVTHIDFFLKKIAISLNLQYEKMKPKIWMRMTVLICFIIKKDLFKWK